MPEKTFSDARTSFGDVDERHLILVHVMVRSPMSSGERRTADQSRMSDLDL
jgi:hypothetical protein